MDDSGVIKNEAQRLFKILSNITNFRTGLKYDLIACAAFAPLALQINKLKKQNNAVILAHYYSAPEIVYGVADYIGDSYALSKNASGVAENTIIFAGVYFMAETAKIINPSKKVFLPAVFAGCSLADSIYANDIINLKQKYPTAPVVCYINSTAAVKAQCDVCVTSSNAYDIISNMPNRQIIFVPDVFMAENIRAELKVREIDKEIISFGGTCCVHDKYTAQDVQEIRLNNPAAKIVCHPECARDVCAASDYTGSTSGMLKYVSQSGSREFAVLSESGILNAMERENPGKKFLNKTKICAQMKRNTLNNILAALTNPMAAEVEVEQNIALKASHAIDNMFKLAGKYL